MKKFILSISVSLISFALTFAQEKGKAEPYRKWEIGINGGGAIFTGEWNMSKGSLFNHFSQWDSQMNFDYGVLLKKNFSHVFALEADWNHANITGSWKFNTRRISNFRTQVIQTDLNSVWNLTNLFSRNKYDRKLYWYGKLGAGVSHLWRREGKYPLFHDNQWKLTVPIGTGVAYSLSNHLKMNAGASWSWVNTDRLDAMKTEAISTKPGNYETQIWGTKLYTYLGFSFIFGKKNKPEPITEPSIPQLPPELKPEPKPEPKPVVKVIKPKVIDNAYKVYFAFDKWNLSKQATIDLDRLIVDMNENQTVNIDIKSHTDSRGAASYNMKLSEKRGKSVIDYLVSKGIKISRINVQAFGETKLVNKCKDGVPCTKAEHAANRRTETIIIE